MIEPLKKGAITGWEHADFNIYEPILEKNLLELSSDELSNLKYQIFNTIRRHTESAVKDIIEVFGEKVHEGDPLKGEFDIYCVFDGPLANNIDRVIIEKSGDNYWINYDKQVFNTVNEIAFTGSWLNEFDELHRLARIEIDKVENVEEDKKKRQLIDEILGRKSDEINNDVTN